MPTETFMGERAGSLMVRGTVVLLDSPGLQHAAWRDALKEPADIRVASHAHIAPTTGVHRPNSSNIDQLWLSQHLWGRLRGHATHKVPFVSEESKGHIPTWILLY